MAMMDNIAMLAAIQAGLNTTDQLTHGIEGLYERQRTLNQIHDLKACGYIRAETVKVRSGEKVIYVLTDKEYTEATHAT